MRKGFLGGVAAILAVVGLSVPAAAAERVSWGACPAGTLSAAEANLPVAAKLECAQLSVPLDYRRPAGGRISVEISRVVSANPAARRGVLLLNPGGPGGSGLDLPVLIGSLAPQSVVDGYDLIGFDPRGVGASTPVSCGLTSEEQLEVFPWPLPGGVPANAAMAKTIADKCHTSPTAGLMPYLTTANTARDMDAIRAALGENKISYLGYSYGTYLGAVYANLYPQRTDRFILDSSVDPTRIWREVFRAWGPATEIRFPDFARWAAARDAVYGLGATPEDVRATYFALAAKLDAQPWHGVTGNMFRSATRGALYQDSDFPALAEIWQKIKLGTATPAMASALARLAPVPADNSISAGLGVLCGDTRWPTSLAGYEHDVRVDSHRFPLVGAMAAGPLPCVYWPTRPIEPLVPITSDGPANILVLNNLRDPATPYFGAVNMARTLGKRASFVTIDEGGHGAYLAGSPNDCVRDTGTRWLVDGKLPGAFAFCPAANAGADVRSSPARDQFAEKLAQPQW